MIHVAISYSHKDESMQDALEAHLSVFERDGLLKLWHDRQLIGGDDVDRSIFLAFDEAHIVLLLVSSAFIKSDYCWSKELQWALERRANGELRVIPVILRPCQWREAPFGALSALPRDGKPISRWPDRDAAYSDVAGGVAAAAQSILRRAREDILEKLAFTYRHNDDLSWYFLGEAIKRRSEHLHRALSSAGAGNVDELIRIVKAQHPANREESYRSLVAIRDHLSSSHPGSDAR
jgi:hypothetical protein